MKSDRLEVSVLLGAMEDSQKLWKGIYSTWIV